MSRSCVMARVVFVGRSGTSARVNGMRRSRLEDLVRLARSMDKAFAVGSVGDCGICERTRDTL